MRLTLDAVDGLRPGQTVVVSIDRSVSLRSVLLLFGLPAAGLVVGTVLGQICPVPGLTADGSSVLLAVLLPSLAFLAALRSERNAAANDPHRPTILRIETR